MRLRYSCNQRLILTLCMHTCARPISNVGNSIVFFEFIYGGWWNFFYGIELITFILGYLEYQKRGFLIKYLIFMPRPKSKLSNFPFFLFNIYWKLNLEFNISQGDASLQKISSKLNLELLLKWVFHFSPFKAKYFAFCPPNVVPLFCFKFYLKFS